jgi:hypothetical protein
MSDKKTPLTPEAQILKDAAFQKVLHRIAVQKGDGFDQVGLLDARGHGGCG